MISALIKLALTLLWLAAAVFLATTTEASHETLRIASAVGVGLPGAYELANRLGETFGQGPFGTRQRVRLALQAGLIRIHRVNIKANIYDDDVTKLSLHVWTVPLWYRRLVPYKLRRKFKEHKPYFPPFLRPPLVRFAMYQFEDHAPSNIGFRKGVGLVGRCITANKPNDICVVRFDSDALRKALKGTEEEWRKLPDGLTQKLKLRQAKKLSEKYRQAAALVITESSGEAIGCVTLGLPKGSKGRFTKPRKGYYEPTDPLVMELRAIASEVQNLLRRQLRRSS
jgi:hypothetical protein